MRARKCIHRNEMCISEQYNFNIAKYIYVYKVYTKCIYCTLVKTANQIEWYIRMTEKNHNKQFTIIMKINY